MYRILPPDISELSVSLPSSKSIGHRIAILGALNSGKTSIHNFPGAEDTDITLSGLGAMGMSAAKSGSELIISSPIGAAGSREIYLGNSGSSARFLLPLAAYLDKPVYFHGDPQLYRRPMAPLVLALRQLGGKIDSENLSLPATVFPSALKGGDLNFDELPSSQVVTGLMLAALWMEDDLHIQLSEDMPSLPYVHLTLDLMKKLQLKAELEGNQILVHRQRPAVNWEFQVEKDLSASTFWVVLAMINEMKVTFRGLSLPSIQGDEKIFEIASQAGSQVNVLPDRVEIEGRLDCGLDIDCHATPDLVPALGVLGLFSPAPIKLRNVGRLRFKESNRIEAIRRNIEVIGGKTEFDGENLMIYPQKKYHGGVIDTFNDHRIAMSFAVAGTRIPGIIIDNPGCVKKSYPEFWRDFGFWEEVE